MLVEDLDTPAVVVDLDVMEANLRRCQSYLDAHGLALRPHIKTHKIPEFARRQIALGARGITCQKLGEAEVMVEAGISDILSPTTSSGRPSSTAWWRWRAVPISRWWRIRPKWWTGLSAAIRAPD